MMDKEQLQHILDNRDKFAMPARLWLRKLVDEVNQQRREINELQEADYQSRMLRLHMDDIIDIVQEAIADMGGDATRRELWNSASNEVIHAFQKYFDERLRKDDE